MASLDLNLKFEYKTIVGKMTDAQLNQMGQEGWELKHLEIRRTRIVTRVIVIYEYLFMRGVA